MGDPQRVSTAARAGESAFARFVERGGRLALWPALYVAGVAFFLSDVSGLPLPTPAYACAFGCTLGSYLLDRVKLGDRWLDPADAPGHEQRRALLRAQAGSLRLVALAALGGGALAGWLVHPLAGALPLASAVGVTLYTVRRPLTTPGRRIKDRLILKNAAVAFSIVALGAALLALARLGAEGAPPLDPARIAVALGAATLFVGSDAALCDVPDAQLDRAHATRTIPVVFGRRATWRLVGALNGVGVGVLLGAGVFGPAPLSAAAWWTPSLAAGFLVLRLTPTRLLRDAVDLRFPLAAAVVVGGRWAVGTVA